MKHAINMLLTFKLKNSRTDLSDLEGYPTVLRIGPVKDWNLRHGVHTRLGDIQLDLWRQIVRGEITHLGEDSIQEDLRAWCQEKKLTCGYCCPEDYALVLHCGRTYTDPRWIGYRDFEAYRRIRGRIDTDEKRKGAA